MTDGPSRSKLTRRDLLGKGAVIVVSGGAVGLMGRLGQAGGAAAAGGAGSVGPATVPDPAYFRLAATDGHILLPGRGSPSLLDGGNPVGDPLYVFGFVAVDPIDLTISQAIEKYKGLVTVPAPIIGTDEMADTYITVGNLGFVVRPDLDDSHTLHWHGFPNQSAIFDGVPEVSIAVPAGRNFPYFYRPRREGTFMYHCHFEDTEHVQMGMQGIVFVRPAQNRGTDALPAGKYGYNDGDGSTAYDREFAILLDELWSLAHDNSEQIQENLWTDYKPDYWTLNGRSYPDTVRLNKDPDLPEQPVSALIQVNPGDRALLRLANLGYEQHAMELPGIEMKVVGEDATLLRGGGQPDGLDLSYRTRIIYIGPGEARDVLFTAPVYDSGKPGGSDAWGPYNRYLFRNRTYQTLVNGTAPGLGGMVTEVRVYDPVGPHGSLPGQSEASETYPNEAHPA
jgi:FtsP/CotA-like multicopper oxidase with cupredoxin domain